MTQEAAVVEVETTPELFYCREVRGWGEEQDQKCTKITYSPTPEWRETTKWRLFGDYKMELPILNRE